MDTKKTILVSVLSTLATLFVVAVIMHMCCGNCSSSNSCSKATTHCSMSSCQSDAMSCKKMKSCHQKKSCKSGKSCSADDMTTDIDVTVTEDGGKKIIKKVIKKEMED